MMNKHFSIYLTGKMLQFELPNDVIYCLWWILYRSCDGTSNTVEIICVADRKSLCCTVPNPFYFNDVAMSKSILPIMNISLVWNWIYLSALCLWLIFFYDIQDMSLLLFYSLVLKYAWSSPFMKLCLLCHLVVEILCFCFRTS